MTNGHPYEEGTEFGEDFVYMSDSTIFGAGRDWTVVKESHRIDHHFGSWRAFAENDSSVFEWTSGSSGARIVATKNGSNWILEFFGREDGKEEESTYFLDFFNVIVWGTIDEFEIGNPLPLKKRVGIAAARNPEHPLVPEILCWVTNATERRGSDWLDWAENNVPTYA
jgi:hypothetical protein